jgi:hypothetical protein
VSPEPRAPELRVAPADPESTRPSVAVSAQVELEEEDLLGPSGPARPEETMSSFDMPRPSIAVAATPPPPPPEPVWRARDWSQEALPTPQGGRNLEAEEEPPPAGDDDDVGPGPLSRVWVQLRNDPYIAVMAGLGVIIFALLLVFLVLRK